MQPPPAPFLDSIVNGAPVASRIERSMSGQTFIRTSRQPPIASRQTRLPGAQAMDLRALTIAALTRTGAVPPRWVRLFNEPSRVSTSATSLPIAGE
jgi:hypothetical protein